MTGSNLFKIVGCTFSLPTLVARVADVVQVLLADKMVIMVANS